MMLEEMSTSGFVQHFPVCLKDLEIVDNRVVRWINVGCMKIIVYGWEHRIKCCQYQLLNLNS